MKILPASCGLVAVLITACTRPEPTPKPTPPAQAEQATEPKPTEPEPAATEPPSIKKGSVTQMSLEQFFLMRGEGKTLVIDVRRSVMFVLGHIDGAINLPLSSFESSFAKHQATIDTAVAQGKVIVLYCDGENCPDAHNSAKQFANRGYSTSIYRGGWEEWKEAGME
ncbi:MAG: rhodanese-like domain-containing protein [Haloferula sp.]